jgi:hypothetical protein
VLAAQGVGAGRTLAAQRTSCVGCNETSSDAVVVVAAGVRA